MDFTLGSLLFQPFSNRMKFGWLELTHGWKRLRNTKLIFPLQCHFCLVDAENSGSSIAKRVLSQYSYTMIGSSENNIFKMPFHFLEALRQPLRTCVIPFILLILHVVVKLFLWAPGVGRVWRTWPKPLPWRGLCLVGNTHKEEPRKMFTFKCSCWKSLCNCGQAFRRL